MTLDEITAAMMSAFPQCSVTRNSIKWQSGGGGSWDSPYVDGDRGQAVTVDGDLSPNELRILADWVNKAGE